MSPTPYANEGFPVAPVLVIAGALVLAAGMLVMTSRAGGGDGATSSGGIIVHEDGTVEIDGETFELDRKPMNELKKVSLTRWIDEVGGWSTEQIKSHAVVLTADLVRIDDDSTGAVLNCHFLLTADVDEDRTLEVEAWRMIDIEVPRVRRSEFSTGKRYRLILRPSPRGEPREEYELQEEALVSKR